LKQEIKEGRDRLCESAISREVGKIDNGIVVTAWGLIDNITFPLIFEVYKPKNDYGDTARSKPEIAAQMVEINQMGFEIELVLADSLYGEKKVNFEMFRELKLNFVVSGRIMEWLPKGQTVRCNRWRKFDRIFSDGTQEYDT